MCFAIPMRTMTWASACTLRLTRHYLLAPGTPAEAAGAVCGIHAQVMSAAEVSLGLRSGVPTTGIREALWTDRTLVKTFGPRGTVHLLPAASLAFWGAAFGSLPSGRSLPPALTLSPPQVTSIATAIGDALAGRFLTIDELSAEVVARAGDWAGALVMPAFQGYWPLWRMALSDAAYRGALCFGPPRGRNVTYTNPSTWLPGSEPSPADDRDPKSGSERSPFDAFRDPDQGGPAAALAMRYLSSYGPATAEQFARWAAIPVKAATAIFEALGGQLEAVQLDGKKAHLPAGTQDMSSVDSGLKLLPLFDAYTVGCHPRDLLFPGKAADRALSGGQAGNVAVMLLNGTVAGVWHQRKTGKKLAITAEPFVKLTASLKRQLESEVDRVGTLVEGTPTLMVGEVTARAHL